MSKDASAKRPYQHIASRAVHAGEHQPQTGFRPTTTPIYATSSFGYAAMDEADAVFAGAVDGYVYSRHGNPTVRALELAVADLEGAGDALAVGSGMAAITLALLNDVQAGDHVLAATDLYGATTNLIEQVFGSLGVTATRVDARNLDAVRAAMAEHRPRAFVVETISNPLLRVADLPALVEIAKAHRCRVIVDNTFASPLLVNPLRLGVDTVIHSTTKYLAGHGDVTGGVVAASASRIADMRELLKLVGPITGPFDAWLTLRGIKTLPLRMERQCDNAAALADFLAQHPRVARVHYPGRADIGPSAAMFNDHRRGGLVAFEIKDAGQEDVFRVFEAMRLCTPATSLGDVYTLVLYPPMSTHRGMADEDRHAMGIADGLVRVSVGIEDIRDITADFDQALAAR